MNSTEKNFRASKPPTNFLLYRFSQFVALLLGFKLSKVAILTLALYISTFFLFNREESLRNFVFDYKVNAIILCTILSTLAGGLINQFYDKDKDQITKPFRSKIQSFLKQKYFLYTYIVLNAFSLTIAAFISERVFVYLFFYQFILWFYSHKLSKLLIINNVVYVLISLYPFFGMLVYYRTFSISILLMAVFLFMILLLMDILKDTLTKNADRVFGYVTIPNYFGNRVSKQILCFLLILLFVLSMLIVRIKGLHFAMDYYFAVGLLLFPLIMNLIISKIKNSNFLSLSILRLWVFIGILSMLADGIFSRLG